MTAVEFIFRPIEAIKSNDYQITVFLIEHEGHHTRPRNSRKLNSFWHIPFISYNNPVSAWMMVERLQSKSDIALISFVILWTLSLNIHISPSPAYYINKLFILSSEESINWTIEISQIPYSKEYIRRTVFSLEVDTVSMFKDIVWAAIPSWYRQQINPIKYCKTRKIEMSQSFCFVLLESPAAIETPHFFISLI